MSPRHRKHDCSLADIRVVGARSLLWAASGVRWPGRAADSRAPRIEMRVCPFSHERVTGVCQGRLSFYCGRRWENWRAAYGARDRERHYWLRGHCRARMGRGGSAAGLPPAREYRPGRRKEAPSAAGNSEPRWRGFRCHAGAAAQTGRGRPRGAARMARALVRLTPANRCLSQVMRRGSSWRSETEWGTGRRG